jgi:Na+/proline symporter
MIEGWVIVALALAYVGGLFVIAWIGDRYVTPERGGGRPLIYALSIGAYCSSWTFFGSVGLASSTGYDFLPTYIGPVLLFVFGWRLIRRIVRVAKKQNITSIADFMAARYGKSPLVAVAVTLVSVVGALPYMALQLTAVSMSVETLLGSTSLWRLNLPFDTAFIVAIAMAAFAILFGTRHIDATEHQDGLILAIATESVVKLAAFLTVGVFVIVSVFGGPASFLSSVLDNADLGRIFAKGINGPAWVTVTLLSFSAVILLPRQFHTIVVENKSEFEISRARWLFPLYLIAINLFVVPIAAAGLVTLPKGSFSPDTFVLALPLTSGANVITMIAFIGGLSAATAMVILDSVAISIMVCNGVIVPLLLGRISSGEAYAPKDSGTASGTIAPLALPLLNIRRCAIFAMLMGGYGVFHLLGHGRGLVTIGLVSFAATAQLAPAFFGGLFWERATARGAIWGISAGITVWLYTLVLPWLVEGGMFSRSLLTSGPFGFEFLVPQALFYLKLDPLSHGVFWSLAANCIGYVTGSLSRAPVSIERTQSAIFALKDVALTATAPAIPSRSWASSITVGELKDTVSRYLGPGLFKPAAKQTDGECRGRCAGSSLCRASSGERGWCCVVAADLVVAIAPQHVGTIGPAPA